MPTVIVIGGGGREHALIDALARSPSRPTLIAAPGNVGTARFADNVPLSVSDVPAIVELAIARHADLVVVGPEAPLVAGLADRLRERGIPVVGPNQKAAELEGSKAFAKAVMDEAQVPTARWGEFVEAGPAIELARSLGGRVAVKADGLAGGKGVIVSDDMASAERAIVELLGGKVGSAGARLVVEERLEGEELSVLALSDGEHMALLAPAQDHKRIGEGDTGPNTGGMGAYSPAPRGTPDLLADVERRCLRPIVRRLAERGAPFSGILYAGVMLTEEGPKVLEYNVRFGDPEAQVLLPRIEEDVFELLAHLADGSLPDRPVRCVTDAAMTVVLAAEAYPGTPRTGDPITGIERAEQLDGVRVFHAGTRLEGERVVTAGGRVLAVTGLGPSLEDAARRAYAGVREIQWPGMQFRRDIGFRALGRAVGAE